MVLILSRFHSYMCLCFYCNITELFHCARALRLDNRKAFRCARCKVSLCFLFWNKDNSCSVQCLFKLLLSTSPVASSCMCRGVVIASSMLEVWHVFRFVRFVWNLACVALRLVDLAAEKKSIKKTIKTHAWLLISVENKEANTARVLKNGWTSYSIVSTKRVWINSPKCSYWTKLVPRVPKRVQHQKPSKEM